MNTRFLVHAILAAASLTAFNASAADLKEVYERALTNDPLIREADANRLATRESKPQARRRPAAAGQRRRDLERHGRHEQHRHVRRAGRAA